MASTARCYASAVLAMVLCPCLCLCLSLVGVLLKWLNVGSQKQHHTIAHDSSFLKSKISVKFDLGHPLRGRQMQVGWVKISDFWQITSYISKTVKDRHIVSIKVNRKSYALYRMVALPMTLSAPKPPHFLYFAPPFIASQRVNLETSNLVHWLSTASRTLPMKNLPWKGRGQGQLTRFRILHPI